MKYKDTPIYERKSITRRGFLKGLGIGLGALAIPTALLASGPEPVVEPEEVHVGYKGSNELDAGYFYCPYVPLMTVGCVNEYGDSTPTMGFNTRYGKLTAPVAQR